MEIKKVRMIVCIALLSLLIPLGYIHARRDVNEEAVIQQDSESEVDVLGLQMDAKSEESSGGNAVQPKKKKKRAKLSRQQARSVKRLSTPITRPSETKVPKTKGKKKGKSLAKESPSKTKVPKRTGPERMIVIILGPPGAGKGTHAGLIAGVLGIVHLSTGDMFRALKKKDVLTSEDKEILAMMESGALIPNATVVGMVKDTIAKPDFGAGFLLDGFPRTLGQAKELVTMLAEQDEKISLVIDLDVPDGVLEDRICGRWTHKKSGRGYHAYSPEVKFLPPKSYLLALKEDKNVLPKCNLAETGEIQDCNMLDDDTNEPLSQRADDNEAALETRLQGFHKSFDPITKYLQANTQISKVKGDQEMNKVCGAVFTQLHAIAHRKGHKVLGKPVPDSFGEALNDLESRDKALADRLRKKCKAQTEAEEAEETEKDYVDESKIDDSIARQEGLSQLIQAAFLEALSAAYKGDKDTFVEGTFHDAFMTAFNAASQTAP